MPFLRVDGARLRLQESDGKGGSRKAALGWAYASVGEKQPFGLVGLWPDLSWKRIRQDLERRSNYPGLEVVILDGDPDIEANLLARWMRLQHWVLHGKRDSPYIL